MKFKKGDLVIPTMRLNKEMRRFFGKEPHYVGEVSRKSRDFPFIVRVGIYGYRESELKLAKKGK